MAENFNKEETRAGTQKFLNTGITYSYDDGVRQSDPIFTDIRELITATFVLNPDSLFYIANLAAKNLLPIISSIEDQLSQVAALNADIKDGSTGRIEDFSAIEEADSKLTKLSFTLSRAADATPQVADYADSVNTFIKQEDHLRDKKNQANLSFYRQGLDAALTELDKLWSIFWERLNLLCSIIEDYEVNEVYRQLADSTITRIKSYLDDLTNTFTDVPTDTQTDLSRQTMIDLVASESVLDLIVAASSPRQRIIASGLAADINWEAGEKVGSDSLTITSIPEQEEVSIYDAKILPRDYVVIGEVPGVVVPPEPEPTPDIEGVVVFDGNYCFASSSGISGLLSGTRVVETVTKIDEAYTQVIWIAVSGDTKGILYDSGNLFTSEPSLIILDELWSGGGGGPGVPILVTIASLTNWNSNGYNEISVEWNWTTPTDVTVTLYINGDVVGTNSTSGAQTDPTVLAVGAFLAGPVLQFPMYGTIDRITVYSDIARTTKVSEWDFEGNSNDPIGGRDLPTVPPGWPAIYCNEQDSGGLCYLGGGGGPPTDTILEEDFESYGALVGTPTGTNSSPIGQWIELGAQPPETMMEFASGGKDSSYCLKTSFEGETIAGFGGVSQLSGLVVSGASASAFKIEMDVQFKTGSWVGAATLMQVTTLIGGENAHVYAYLSKTDSGPDYDFIVGTGGFGGSTEVLYQTTIPAASLSDDTWYALSIEYDFPGTYINVEFADVISHSISYTGSISGAPNIVVGGGAYQSGDSNPQDIDPSWYTRLDNWKLSYLVDADPGPDPGEPDTPPQPGDPDYFDGRWYRIKSIDSETDLTLKTKIPIMYTLSNAEVLVGDQSTLNTTLDMSSAPVPGVDLDPTQFMLHIGGKLIDEDFYQLSGSGPTWDLNWTGYVNDLVLPGEGRDTSSILLNYFVWAWNGGDHELLQHISGNTWGASQGNWVSGTVSVWNYFAAELLEEGVHYTVDLVNGQITFTGVPPPLTAPLEFPAVSYGILDTLVDIGDNQFQSGSGNANWRPGTELVFNNGAPLSRGVDYTVNYISGVVTITGVTPGTVTAAYMYKKEITSDVAYVDLSGDSLSKPITSSELVHIGVVVKFSDAPTQVLQKDVHYYVDFVNSILWGVGFRQYGSPLGASISITATYPMIDELEEFYIVRGSIYETYYNRFLDGIVVPVDTAEQIGVNDGATLTFTLDHYPVVRHSVKVYLNGTEVPPDDYTVNYLMGVVTFTSFPQPGVLSATYEYLSVGDVALPAELSALRRAVVKSVVDASPNSDVTALTSDYTASLSTLREFIGEITENIGVVQQIDRVVTLLEDQGLDRMSSSIITGNLTKLYDMNSIEASSRTNLLDKMSVVKKGVVNFDKLNK